jgi:hypothetical protein
MCNLYSIRKQRSEVVRAIGAAPWSAVSPLQRPLPDRLAFGPAPPEPVTA